MLCKKSTPATPLTRFSTTANPSSGPLGEQNLIRRQNANLSVTSSVLSVTPVVQASGTRDTLT